MSKIEQDNTKLRQPYYFKEWREFSGLSQTQLATLMGVAPGTVSRVESGTRQFTQGWLEDFALVLGIPGGPGTVLVREPDKAPERLTDVDIERRHFELAHQLARPAIKAVRKSRDSNSKGRQSGPKGGGAAKSA